MRQVLAASLSAPAESDLRQVAMRSELRHPPGHRRVAAVRQQGDPTDLKARHSGSRRLAG